MQWPQNKVSSYLGCEHHLIWQHSKNRIWYKTLTSYTEERVGIWEYVGYGMTVVPTVFLEMFVTPSRKRKKN